MLKKMLTNKKVKTFVTEIQIMNREYKNFQISGDHLSSIVSFFRMTTKFSDQAQSFTSDVREKLNPEVQADYDLVVRHLRNAGRGNMNRAEAGQEINDHNVYLGDVYGIWTNTVAFFKQERMKTSPGGCQLRAGGEASVYDVINDQARGFIKNHLEMTEVFDRILKKYNYLLV